MIINVTELLKGTGQDADLAYTEKVSYPEDDLVVQAPISVQAHLVNSGQGILVTGQIKAEVELTCCRCLNAFRQRLVAELHERYIQSVAEEPDPVEPEGADADGVELQESDFVSPMESETEINMAEAVRQNLLMTVPMKPLCRPDCPGIPEARQFGAGQPGDPRWNKLKDIL